MRLYKLSSQFTTFVKARSSNPDKILDQVSDAIETLGEMGVPLPGSSAVLEAFHASDSIDDEFVLSHLGGIEAAPIVNQMYNVLAQLASSGKVDMITRKVIETFLRSGFRKLKEPEKQISPTVVRRRKKEEPEAITEIIEIDEPEMIARWQRPEDRMISRLDRERTASLLDLFAKAGVLEQLPSFKERQIRLAERSFEWTKLVK
jgi:hypothetical protein